MKKIKFILSIISFIFLMTGCSYLTARGRGVSRATGYLQQNKPLEALSELKTVLATNPDYEPAYSIFSSTYNLAFNQIENDIEIANSPYQKALAYKKLSKLKEIGSTLNLNARPFIVLDYPTLKEVKEIKLKTADYFLIAAENIKPLTRENKRKIYFLTKQALNYNPRSENIRNLFKKRKENATDKIAVIGKEVYSEVKNNLAKSLNSLELGNAKVVNDNDFNLLKENYTIVVEISSPNINYIPTFYEKTRNDKSWIEKTDLKTGLKTKVNQFDTNDKDSRYDIHEYIEYIHTKKTTLTLNINYSIFNLISNNIIKQSAASITKNDEVTWSTFSSYELFKFPKLPKGTYIQYEKPLKTKNNLLQEAIQGISLNLTNDITKILK